jgi:signal transduction histidine kinase
MNAEPSLFERWCGAGSEPHHELLSAVRILRRRPWVMGVTATASFILLRLAGFPVRRFVILLAIFALPLTLAVLNAMQSDTPRGGREKLWRSLFATDVFSPAFVLATGGLRSPFLPILLANVIVMVMLWRKRRSVTKLLIGFAILTGLLALVPSQITGPPIPSPYFELLTALNLVSALYMTVQVVVAVSEGFMSARRSLLSVRERMIEAAEQRVRSLEQVGSKVAHELKNPLAAIKSLLQLEAKPFTDAASPDPLSVVDFQRSRRRLEVMASEVVRMEAILRDYLSFSRPLEDLRLGSVDLAAVADTVVLLLEGRTAAADVRLTRSGEPNVMAGDARRLEEALLNIATNAVEATPAGGSVTIRTEQRACEAVIVVADTGKGMTPLILEKVGTPFFTTRKDGTGLGVVLARAVLAQHGGRLEYESRPGEGTTVTLTLPDRSRMAAVSARG